MSLFNYPTIRPSLILDFQKAEVVDPRITFTRASTATRFNSYGVLETVANNIPRIDYNPTTLVSQGLLIEEQRTNSIRNNTMQGAVAGTPGTAPTNWTLSTTGATTTQIVGTGTENGITYIDLRIQGTGAADTWNWIYDSSVVAANGQIWTGSIYLKLAAGSTANLPFIQRLVFRNSGFANIQQVDSSVLTPTNAGLATQRNTISLTATQATTAFVTLQLNSGTPTGAYDITLRIGLPQLEQGAFATSVIPTTTTALTRNADVASMTGTNFSSWYNQSEGTLLAQVIYNADTSCKVVFINDGTYNNIFSLQREVSLDRWQTDIFSAASRQALLNFATNSASVGSVSKCASVYKVNDFAGSANGGAVITDTSGLVQASVDRLALGRDNVGSAEFLNGYIQRISYYPVRLPNSTLQALTST